MPISIKQRLQICYAESGFLFAHPTLSESFGVVVLEALAAGCAVITSAMASLPELVTKANGILLPIPLSIVVGDFSIPMFANASDFARLLNQANLSAFERDLTEAMVALATIRGSERACSKVRAIFTINVSPVRRGWKGCGWIWVPRFRT